MSIITYCKPILLTRILKCLLLTLNRCSCFSHGVGSSGCSQSIRSIHGSLNSRMSRSSCHNSSQIGSRESGRSKIRSSRRSKSRRSSRSHSRYGSRRIYIKQCYRS